METVILVFHVVVAVFLVAAIMLQSGKGADIGAAFGAGGSQTMFGPRGAATVLHKITIVAASLFLITSITLTYFSRQQAGTILDAVPATTGETLLPAEDIEAEPAEPTEPTE